MPSMSASSASARIWRLLSSCSTWFSTMPSTTLRPSLSLSTSLSSIRRSSCGRRRISGSGFRPVRRSPTDRPSGRATGYRGLRSASRPGWRRCRRWWCGVSDSLLEIGFQGARQDVAAFGQLADMAGDHLVDVELGLGELLRVFLQHLRQVLAAGCQPFEMALRATVSMVTRWSLILRRSSSRAREIALRPSASFWTWLLTAASMLARPSANLARSACRAAAMRSRPSESLRVWFSTAWSMPARASASFSMSASKARDTTWRACSRRPAKSPARASSMEEVDIDDVGHFGADARLALVDHAEQRVACPR